MSTLQEIISAKSFQSYTTSLPSSVLLVLSFHAPWAAPCAQMRTLLTTLASTYQPTSPPQISFMSLDAEALPDISESYDVTAVPFLVLQRDGRVLQSISGCDAAKVRDAVEKWVGKGDVGAARGATKKAELPPKLEVTPRNKNPEDTDSKVNSTSTVAKNLSTYAPEPADSQTAPAMSGSAIMPSSDENPKSNEDTLSARLASLVKAAPVMLFMKGTPSSPQCGFSRQLVGMLREKGVRYGFFNILADEDVRQGLKAWAEWSTYPQLWVGGELVGGLDIVKEELDNDPEFFKDYAVAKGRGGMATAEAHRKPQVAGA